MVKYTLARLIHHVCPALAIISVTFPMEVSLHLGIHRSLSDRLAIDTFLAVSYLLTNLWFPRKDLREEVDGGSSGAEGLTGIAF